jgi:hypothetical protein
VQVSLAGEQAAEVLPPLRIQRHDLTVQNHVPNSQLLPDPVTQLLKLFQHIPALRSEMALLAAQIEEAAEAA